MVKSNNQYISKYNIYGNKKMGLLNKMFFKLVSSINPSIVEKLYYYFISISKSQNAHTDFAIKLKKYLKLQYSSSPLVAYDNILSINNKQNLLLNTDCGLT